MFNLFDPTTAPTWQASYERYADFIPHHAEFPIARSEAEQLHAVFKKKAAHRATSLDGWRMKEVHLLPPQLLELFIDVFIAVEGGDPWPIASTTVPQVFLRKNCKCIALDGRELAITSVWYSGYGSCRNHDLAE